jgi:hypothetical protein
LRPFILGDVLVQPFHIAGCDGYGIDAPISILDINTSDDKLLQPLPCAHIGVFPLLHQLMLWRVRFTFFFEVLDIFEFVIAEKLKRPVLQVYRNLYVIHTTDQRKELSPMALEMCVGEVCERHAIDECG